MKKIIQPGTRAPAFSLPDSQGNIVKLADYKGKWVVVYFYPKDLTPGCTTEAINFSRLKPEFEKMDTDILGISADPPQKHLQFIEKKELSITLLSDEDKSMITSWGAWQMKKFMGKEFMGIVRSTWIVDPNGIIAAAWDKVKVKDHATEVLEKLRELQTA
jgi:peroxiredoxin Q/BCP